MSRTPRSVGPRWAAATGLGFVSGGLLLDAFAGGRLVETPWASLAEVATGCWVGASLRPRGALIAVALAAAALSVANQLGAPGAYSLANDYCFFAVLIGGTVLAGALISGRRRQLRSLRELSQVRHRQHVAEVRGARLDEHLRMRTAIASSMQERLEELLAHSRRARDATASDAGLAVIEQGGRAVLDGLRAVLARLPDVPAEPDPPEPRAEAAARPALTWVDALAACSGVPLAVEAVAGAHSRGPAVANVLLALLVGLPLLVRRRRPLTSTALALGVATVMSAVLTPLPATVSVLVPLSLTAYAVGAQLRGGGRVAGVVLLLAGTGATVAVSPAADRDPAGLLPTLAWLGLAVLFGVVAEQYAGRAAQLRLLLAHVERGRRHELALVAAEQRALLAGELHDSLAHAMTVVCLHAEAAQLPGVTPAAVRASLETVETVTRDALVELRRGLAALVGESGPLSLGDQIAAVARGLALHPVLEVEAGADLDAEQSTLLLRVVREALVNVVRHAPGAPLTVRVQVLGGIVNATVRNGAAGRGPASAPGTGSGLRNLQRRVGSAGGRLHWGALPGGGYEVGVELPLTVAAAVSVPVPVPVPEPR